ncbi:hypothetical protein ABH15_10460 [Methanoculleus taiwanensis]|uniref:Uncharacterized protein n=1 Tax=Methanoculleus taiwanensis TaxID=1550565 RepID=A0A498H0N0_9EURY|nr:hypothetical protein ABH15_10460 [Methanoculleus taiwanensis]
MTGRGRQQDRIIPADNCGGITCRYLDASDAGRSVRMCGHVAVRDIGIGPARMKPPRSATACSSEIVSPGRENSTISRAGSLREVAHEPLLHLIRSRESRIEGSSGYEIVHLGSHGWIDRGEEFQVTAVFERDKCVMGDVVHMVTSRNDIESRCTECVRRCGKILHNNDGVIDPPCILGGNARGCIVLTDLPGGGASGCTDDRYQKKE